MTRPPAVSVLMTAWNAAPFLEAAVRSVLGQTHDAFELVVVDDGSTDATPEVLTRLAREDARMRVLRQPNAGISAAANAGLAACRGRLVARMDSDDVAHPRRLERQTAWFGRRGVVCCGSWHDLIDEADRRIKTIRTPVEDAEIQRLTLEGHGAICHPSSLFERDAARRVGGYDESLAQAEDLDLWLKLGELGPLGNVPEVLLSYRLHAGSVSERKNREQRDCARRACEAAWARRGVTGRFTAGYAWRPGFSRSSRHTYACRYGWWAFSAGERETAAYYGRRAAYLMPWRPEGWKLWYAARHHPSPVPKND